MKRFSLLTLFICLMLSQTHAQVLSQDSLALVNIYNSTSGSAWTQKWIRTQPVNTWFGVTVTAGRVTGIDLASNNLVGTLNSASITRLTKLKILNLAHNAISGGIPPGIGSLTDLEQLDISFNAFSNTTPSALFNNLQQLTHVNFANNNISGWFPAIGKATALVEVNFSNNAITNKIPATVNDLTNLTKFFVQNNKLYGTLPAGKLCSPSLEIDISGNYFTFSGLECLGSNPNATYNNQHDLTLAQSNLRLSVAAGGTLANNTYTWYRNGGAAPYFVATGNNKLNTTSNGKYWAVITNSAAPALILRTDTLLLSGSITTDSLALVDLYNNTNGVAWINKTNWLTSAPLSEWFGVGINEGRIESLWLSENNLDGELPASFENLPLAYELVLNGNKLKGAIPRSFASSDVFHIDLSFNQFTSIPADYNITTGYLDLSNNLLSGSVPATVFNTGTIKLNNNKFTFAALDNLTRPYGDYITIYPQAAIPIINENSVLKVSVGGTPSKNQFSWYMNNSDNLVKLTVGDSTFTPTENGTYYARISNYDFRGFGLFTDTITITFQNSTADSLALVDIYNDITAGLNWVLTDPVNTWDGVRLEGGRVVELYVEHLTGTLNPSIGNLSELKYLWIHDGSLSGNIPSTIANLTNLEELHIYANNFTGSIPDDIGRNQSELHWLDIADNPLTGNIPSGLEYATSLSELYIGGTQISGAIPGFFKNLEISTLNLPGNKLTGSIPDSLSSEGLPSYLNLSNNLLTGAIPQWTTYGTIGIDLSHNQLSGSLPNGLNQLGTWVSLNNNQLTGAIPKLDGGYSLKIDISNNLLEYVDPVNCEGNASDYPETLNLSNNKLNFDALECLKSNPNFDGIINPQQRIPIINENPVLKAAAGGTLASNTYKWYKNAALIATNPGDSTLTITTPGLYYCIVTNSNVAGVELRTDSVNISTVSSRKMQGIIDATSSGYSGKLSVYPNPTGAGFIYIKGLQKAESVLLYNAAGQLVKQWQNINGNQQLNIADVTGGIYMMKIVEKDKQTMLKFVKE